MAHTYDSFNGVSNNMIAATVQAVHTTTTELTNKLVAQYVSEIKAGDLETAAMTRLVILSLNGEI